MVAGSQYNLDSHTRYEESEFGASPAASYDQTMNIEVPEKPPTMSASIQASVTFYPYHDSEIDMIVVSDDAIYFYAHTASIRYISEKALEHFLSYAIPDVKETIVLLPLSSAVLNVILHTIYGTSCAKNAPTCEELVEAVDKLAVMGVALNSLILPDTPLYTVLTSHAPRRPLDIYALAAHHDLFDLAKYASFYLRAFPLSNVSDEVATRIGTRYLKRIFFLQMTRSAALKELVMSVPTDFHPPTKTCKRFDWQQRTLARVWAAGAADLAWDLAPGSSPSTLFHQCSLTDLLRH